MYGHGDKHMQLLLHFLYRLVFIFSILPLLSSLSELGESVERGPHVWEIGSSVPSRVKPMTYKIDTCRFLAWHSALIG